MRLLCGKVALLFVLALSASVLGQDLTYYNGVGRLAPHVATGGKVANRSLLIYRTRGLMFDVFHGRAWAVAVFPCKSPPPAAPYLSRADLVIPGVGACGVTLGMPGEQVGTSPFLRYATKQWDDAKSAFYDVDSATKLLVLYSTGSTSQVQVYGPFATPEEIGYGSSEAAIRAVYGTPDQQYDVWPRRGSTAAPRVLLIMPLLGLGTGLVIRGLRQRMPQSNRSVAWIAAFGAASLAVAAGSVSLGSSMVAGGGPDYRSLWCSVADAILTGTGAVLVLQLLPARVGGRLASPITLLVMLAVAQIANLLVGFVTGSAGRVVPTAWLFPSFTGPFVVTMFLAAGAKRTE